MFKIVVVEDEDFLRQAIISATPWEQWGCQVVGEAGNAIDGIARVEQLLPDIVIADIRMPEMSGLSMIEVLKESVDAEYIIISGYDEFDYAKKAVGFGVMGYLLKPIDDLELETTVKKATSIVSKKKSVQRAELETINKDEDFVHSFFDDAKDSNNTHAKKTIWYINEFYAEDLTINNVAIALGISGSYVSKLLKQETGYTFLEVLTRIRMKKAKEMLDGHENLRNYEISEAVGYKDARYFSDTFKKRFGIFPSEYRQNEKKKE